MSPYVFTKSRRLILGFLLLTEFVLGILVKQVSLGARTFRPDYWEAVWSPLVSVRGPLFEFGIVAAAVSVMAVVVLNPVFIEKDRHLHLFFRMSFIVAFLVSLSELVWLSGLSSFRGNPESLLVFGTSYSVEAALEIRWWTHYLALFFSAIAGVAFYMVLMAKSIVPRWLSWWGLVGAYLLSLTMLIAMFGGETYMLLMLPLGLNRLVLSAWLLIAPGMKTES